MSGRDERAALSVTVARATSTIEAHLIAGLLETHGIRAAVSADDAGGAEPQFQLTAGVRVLVASEDAEEASQLLQHTQT